MSYIRSFLFYLFTILLYTACGGDDMMENESKECILKSVNVGTEAVSFTTLDINYGEDGSISEAGFETYAFTYGPSGNITTAITKDAISTLSRELKYTYENGFLTIAREFSLDDTEDSPSYTYEFIYDGKYLDKIIVKRDTDDETELDFEFDDNGNVLKYISSSSSNLIQTLTYDTDNKGLFSTPMLHKDALAYYLATDDVFWFWNNAISSYDRGDDVVIVYENTYTEQGLLKEAIADIEGKNYYIGYRCR